MLQKSLINNDIYKSLDDKWYTGNDYVALLRSEARARNPYIKEKILHYFSHDCKILDIGCGGGLLCNDLANISNNIIGIDMHAEPLIIARKYNTLNNVNYMQGNALQLPFANETFDAVSILDVLEHVDSYEIALSEAIRVLKKEGLLFFHTFNRNLFTKYFVIKAMEWFVKGTPKHLHVYQLFIKPQELINYLSKENCNLIEVKGLNPKFTIKNFTKLLFKNEVDANFSFTFSNRLHAGYIGFAQKKGINSDP